jgi:hypothetical protein
MWPAPSFRSWHVGETPLLCVAQHVVAVSSARRWARYGYMGLQVPRCVGNPMVIRKAPHHREFGVPDATTLRPTSVLAVPAS